MGTCGKARAPCFSAMACERQTGTRSPSEGCRGALLGASRPGTPARPRWAPAQQTRAERAFENLFKAHRLPLRTSVSLLGVVRLPPVRDRPSLG